jgi:hypothetical protein
MKAQSVTSVTDENLTTKTVVIPNGATGLSGEVDLQGYKLAAIQMPAAWQAASITLLGSNVSGGTFQNVYDDSGTEVTIAAAASRCIVIDAAAMAFAALRFMKFRSGTSAIPVDQTASRTLTLILKG